MSRLCALKNNGKQDAVHTVLFHIWQKCDAEEDQDNDLNNTDVNVEVFESHLFTEEATESKCEKCLSFIHIMSVTVLLLKQDSLLFWGACLSSGAQCALFGYLQAEVYKK